MSEISPAPTWWPWQRWRDRSPFIGDSILAALLLGLGLLTIGNEPTEYVAREPDVLAYALTIVGFGVLVARRRLPLTVLGVTTFAAAGCAVREYPENGLAIAAAIALYTVGSLLPPRRSRVAAAGVAVVIVALTLMEVQGLDIGGGVGNMALFGGAYAYGNYIRVRRAYTEQLELRAADAEVNQRRESERAVTEERLRIARELHDVVAHAMSVVAVQSGVAAHVIDQQPDEAKDMLENINTTSREALDEMRRMLGVLRSDDDPASLRPAPTLGDLRSLVASVESTGVSVELTTEGEPSSLPPAVDLTAFRIVQEALTNVVKHAGPAVVHVRVAHRPDQIELEIIDDGRGAASSPYGLDTGGHGLVGMRERVEAFDGTLDVGPRPGGGYRVRARLPVANGVDRANGANA